MLPKRALAFPAKKKRNKYEVYFISGNLLKKIKNCFTGLLPAILTIQASNNYLVLMVRFKGNTWDVGHFCDLNNYNIISLFGKINHEISKIQNLNKSQQATIGMMVK